MGTTETDWTHDPSRKSWVETANGGETDFPIQNLPVGCFRRLGEAPRGGIAIGDQIVDLAAVVEAGLLTGDAARAAGAASGEDLLPLLAMGQEAGAALRKGVSALLVEGSEGNGPVDRASFLIAQADVEMLLPAPVRSFSDMCVSTFHIGRRRGQDERGEPICPPVFRVLPVGYDGRASSVVVSGTAVRRPNGTWTERHDGGDLHFGPEPRQDYELEMAGWIAGPGNSPGQPLSMSQARRSLFGLSLLNDWSARGIQFWETMLGPFLGKSIATTVSPWIVTEAALAPFQAPAFVRPDGDPAVPVHLRTRADQASGGFGISLTAELSSQSMRDVGHPALKICQTDFRHMYWTWAQMIAHHASNGCYVTAGDLIGSGTCSGPAIEEAACLLERTSARAIQLPGGEHRTWLEDGDRIVLRGRCEREGFVPIGFGEAVGELLPALSFPIED